MSLTQLGLPGSGLPVNHMPENPLDDEGRGRLRFPYAITDWAPHPVTAREQTMVSFISQITEKEDWRRKVFDDTIVSRWKQEKDAVDDFTDAMFDFVSLLRNDGLDIELAKM